jgi:uncharacterized protein (TIGR00369 family)
MSHTPLNPSYQEEVTNSFAQQSIMDHIGAQLTRVEPGIVEITLAYRPDITQQHGFIHAGVLATIADSACGYAAYSLMPPGAEVLSVEFKINMLRPAKGDSFRALAEVIKSGRTLTVVNANVFALSAAKEELVATMLGTMICLRK